MASKRVLFVDVLRLIALAQMVNGHTLHAVLQPVVRQGEFYQGYLWFRGLVSVAFMLVAGLAFQITTLARFEQHRADPAAVKRRVLRALEIIAIGFLLRFPVSSLITLDVAGLERGLWGLTRIDVLPCIGVSLLVLEGLVFVARRPAHVIAACGLLAVTCTLLAPWGASLPVHGPIAFLTGWLGPRGGSQFPLLPYAGYVFAGVVIGAMALPSGAPAPRLFACGALLFAFGWLTTVPAAQRLGAVTLAIGVLALALQQTPRLPRTLAILSGETLALYVFHLLVLYGEPLALHRRIGETLALGPALGLSACMLVSTALFGLGWQRVKHWRPLRRALPSERTIVFASAATLSLTLLLVGARAFAQAPVNANGTQYAIGGYDPVAYFDAHAAVRGKPEFELRSQGARWLFASDAHRRAFEAEPAHYAPAYGGHCAYAAAQSRLVTIDPNAWSILDDRLYLNYSIDIRKQWDADRARYIRAADAYWSKLSAARKSRAEVRSVALTVADLDAAERFFVDVLGFAREGTRVTLAGPELEGLIGLAGAHGLSTRLRLGRERVELIAYDAPAGRPVPADSRSNDLWFQHLALVTSNIDALQPRLAGSAISRGAQTIPKSNPAAGGIRAFYFRGPAAHPLELIWYPQGKGIPRWQTGGAPLLGIDHTAIAVADSARSRAFYTDLLGLELAGQSFNFGREQEALSGVAGARVRITGLRGAEGPGVELLEYETPRDARPAPSDTRATDLWSGEITITVTDLDATLAKLRAAGVRIVSDRVRDTRAVVPGTRRGVVVRDPDGHAVRIVQ